MRKDTTLVYVEVTMADCAAILQKSIPIEVSICKGAIEAAVRLTVEKYSRTKRRHFLVLWRSDSRDPPDDFKLDRYEINFLGRDGKVKIEPKPGAKFATAIGDYIRLVEYAGHMEQTHMILVSLYSRYS